MTTDVPRSGLIYLLMGDQVSEMREVPYEAEKVLQDLISQHPRILAGEQVDLNDPRRWLLIAQEAGVPGETDGYDRWSIDHLVVDQEGIPTIVEVKRSSDTRVRREVVGQMLDYAANASVYWSVDRLRSLYEERVSREGADPAELLATSLQLDGDVESFWDQVKRNFEGGVLRLVFVADVIPPELRRVIEYMDDQMTRTQVVGIEVRRYRSVADPTIAVLVPRVVAQSARRQVLRTSEGAARRLWDEASFMDALASKRADDVLAAQALVSWAKARGLRLWFGSGQLTGSIYAVLDVPDGRSYSIFSVWSSGSLNIEFRSLAGPGSPYEPTERRMQLLARLNAIDGVSLPPDRIDKATGVRLAVFTDASKRAQVVELLDSVLAEFAGPIAGASEVSHG